MVGRAGDYLANSVVGCARYCHRDIDMSTFQPMLADAERHRFATSSRRTSA